MSAPSTPTIIHNGIERPTVNNRGEPIADNEAKLTAFWDWFADSKGVDENGCPIILFRCQPTAYPVDENISERYFARDINYALTYHDFEEEHQVIKVYLKSENLSAHDNKETVITDFMFYKLGLPNKGFDAVCDSDVFVALGGDHQFRQASEFNLEHASLGVPGEPSWSGRPYLDQNNKLTTPICGVTNGLFMSGYEYHNQPSKETPNPMIIRVWREPKPAHQNNLISAKIDALRLADESRPRRPAVEAELAAATL